MKGNRLQRPDLPHAIPASGRDDGEDGTMIARMRRHIDAADGTRVAWHLHQGTLGPRARTSSGAVLLTNGVGTSENFWRFVTRALATTRVVAHWDYRGHGASEVSRGGDYRLERHVEDLEAVTDAVRAQTGQSALHHVGFSMGVRVLLEAYRRRPDTFASLTVIAGGAGAPGPEFVSGQPLTRELARQLLDALRPAVPLVSPALKAVMGSPLVYPLARLSGVVRPRAAKQDIVAMARHMRGMDLHAFFDSVRALLDGDSSDVLATVRVPALVINAKRDLLMSPAAVERLYRALPPGSRWMELEEAGHAGLVEAGDEIGKELAGFLDDAERTALRRA